MILPAAEKGIHAALVGRLDQAAPLEAVLPLGPLARQEMAEERLASSELPGARNPDALPEGFVRFHLRHRRLSMILARVRGRQSLQLYQQSAGLSLRDRQVTIVSGCPFLDTVERRPESHPCAEVGRPPPGTGYLGPRIMVTRLRASRFADRSTLATASRV